MPSADDTINATDSAADTPPMIRFPSIARCLVGATLTTIATGCATASAPAPVTEAHEDAPHAHTEDGPAPAANQRSSGLSATPSMSDDARARWREVQEAMGGAVAIEAVHSITTVAAVSTPNGSGQMGIQSFADGRLVFDQLRSNGDQQRVEVVPGEGGDLVVAEDGPRPLEPRMSAFMRGHEFHRIVLAPALRYRDGRLGEPQRFAEHMCEVIEFTDAFGKPLQLLIDPRSGLPAGFIMIEPMSEDDAPITVTLSNWKPFGTLMLFTALRIEHRGQRFEYDYETIELNRRQ